MDNDPNLANDLTGGSSMTHELDQQGEKIHVDIDPFIPTGTCAVCAGMPQETEPPEDRNNEPE